MSDCSTVTEWFFGVGWLEVFKAVSDLLVGIGWPLAVLMLGFIFRNEIRTKVGDIASAGPSGVTFREQQQPKQEGTDTELKVVDEDKKRPAQVTVEKAIIDNLQAIEQERRIPVLVTELAFARMARQFEQIYSIIFGSQIKGLQQLQNIGGHTSREDAEKFYEAVKADFPEVHEKRTFTDWFKFLENANLVHVQGDRFAISDLGREFLVFVAESKVGWTPRPF